MKEILNKLHACVHGYSKSIITSIYCDLVKNDTPGITYYENGSIKLTNALKGTIERRMYSEVCALRKFLFSFYDKQKFESKNRKIIDKSIDDTLEKVKSKCRKYLKNK